MYVEQTKTLKIDYKDIGQNYVTYKLHNNSV